MGAYSPAPVVTPAVHERAMHEVMWPTVRALAAEGTPYVGFLYAGLMIAADGTPKVLEFNCRFGDPETQPILFRLKSDLVALCLAALEGRLDRVACEWDARAALGVVLAADGYPENYRKGDPISGLDADAGRDDVKIFHAGTRLQDGQVLVRHHFLSLDPYMRGRMNEGKSYAAAQPLNQVMIGGTVGED
jgi:phosphoribosylamine--glycine ligase